MYNNKYLLIIRKKINGGNNRRSDGTDSAELCWPWKEKWGLLRIGKVVQEWPVPREKHHHPPQRLWVPLRKAETRIFRGSGWLAGSLLAFAAAVVGSWRAAWMAFLQDLAEPLRLRSGIKVQADYNNELQNIAI